MHLAGTKTTSSLLKQWRRINQAQVRSTTRRPGRTVNPCLPSS